jgi:ferrochelatase
MMFRSKAMVAMLLATALPMMAACGDGDQVTSRTASLSEHRNVGVLLASHGDIDELSELEDYIKVAFNRNVGIPLPQWVRGPITGPAYLLSVGNVRSQYEQIGPTRYRANAFKQVAAVSAAMQRLGIPGKAYFGANFARPYIDETLDQMRRDGVDTILVFNKGAQFSYASSGENMDDVLRYLNEHRDWDVKAIGRFEYSEDVRFREVWAQAIERDLKANFPATSPGDVCILVGSHGLPTWLTDRGDPAVRQMRRAVDWLEQRLAGYHVYHGFLNDDFFPGASWVKPDAATAAASMRADACSNVLMDGRLSFTTHHRATLYDLNVVAREILEEPDLGPDGERHPLFAEPKVVLASNFDDDAAYADLMVQLTAEALADQGDTIVLKERGKAALRNGSISKPGAFAAEFARFAWPQ